MAKGRTTCQYCGDNIPSSYLKTHLRKDHPDVIKPLKTPIRSLKILVLSLEVITLAYISYSTINPYFSMLTAFLWGAILADLVINVKKLKRKLTQNVTITKIGESKRMDLKQIVENGKTFGRKLKENTRAASPTTVAMSLIVVVLGIYMFALMFPDAIYELFNVTWHASVPDGVETMATTIVAIIGVVVFILLLLKQAD